MHGMLMANRHRVTPVDIPRMAHQLGVDAARFQADLDGAATMAAVAEDRDESRVQSVSTTPLLFVNGRSVAAPLAASRLRAAIQAALAGR
jgi:protein-disulfide isomerase